MLDTPPVQVRSRNANHPKKGSTTKVEPIRDLKAIKRIKKLLVDNPRDLALFTLGINTAYRANELLSLTVGQVAGLHPGDTLEIRQSKQGKVRITTLNQTAYEALRDWLAVHPDPMPDRPLFRSQKGGALSVSTVTNLVKEWCANVGLHGQYGSHTLRKTWGFHRLRGETNVPAHMVLPMLMVAFGHSSQQQTLDYLCIQSEEIAGLYLAMEL